MNKLSKTILTGLIAVFATGLLFTPLTFAQAQNLIVDFEQTPLFNEVNFAPGDSVIRWLKVTNNSSEAQNIAAEAINYPGFPNPENVSASDLSRALSIVIREKYGNDLYGGTTGEKTLFDFYRKYGFNSTYEHVLTWDLTGNGANVTYEFVITFPSEKENEWQAATTTFDILIGFQGKEGGPPPPPPPGGPGLPPGLTIQEESVRVTTITETNATITWTTSYFSTGQVIYDTVLGKFSLTAGPPNYGYGYSKEGDDSGLEKVTGHSVTITGLTSGTTYYYRAVSHASLAISREYSFTTLGVKEEELIPPEEEIIPPKEEIPVEEEIPVPKEIVRPPEEIVEEKVPEEAIEEEAIVEEEIEKPVLVEKRPLGEIFASEGLLAAIGAMPLNLKIILIIAGIIIIGLIILWLIRKRRKKKLV